MRGGTLVDIGCGSGLTLALLTEAAATWREGGWPGDMPAPPPVIAVIRIVFAVVLFLAPVSIGRAADSVNLKLGYLHRTEPKEAISLLDVPAVNNGVAGTRLGLEDNNTTGKFLNQHFELEEMLVSDKDDPGAAVLSVASKGAPFVLVDLPAEALLKAADAVLAKVSALETPK